MRHLTLHSTRLVTNEGPQAIVASGTTRNMYGCLPCPKCGSGHRAAYRKAGRRVKGPHIACDDCDSEQPAVFGEGYRR